MHSNNIKPCWWGGCVWKSIYCITATYPEIPSKEHIESARTFFKSLIFLLPCEGCQQSYSIFTCETNTNVDNLENFKNKENLIKFVYNLRNKVNNKLTHNYGIDLNYFKKKLLYMTINTNNKFDGKICEMVEAPIIPEELEKKVYLYLKYNTSFDPDYTKKLLETIKNFMNNPI